MLLHARLFGRGMGMDLDIAVEKLNVSGRMYATLTLNMDAPFPHITHLSLTFVDKPEVWFSVRILKAVQMMEIPLLKTWIHSLVMDALVLALVDPGQLDLNLTLAERPPRKQESGNTVVQGVLTVTLSTDHTSGEDVRWLTVSLGGEQRHRTSPLSPRWQDSPSFLVRSLTGDRLLVKLKSKRLVSSVTLTQYDVPLASYNLDTTRVVETVLYKKISLTSIPRISVRLEYTPLPLAPLDTDLSAEDVSAGTVSGVVFAYIHGAEGLMSGEQGDCNPYCMLFKKGTKVKTTHYLRGTSSPQWESQVQFLVRDYTKVALSFVVCSWSPNRMSDARLLGLASFNMALGETRVVRRVLPLNGSGHASVTVSLVFHPVQSVSQSEPTPCQEESKEDDTCRFPREKRNSNSWVQQAKQLLNNKEQDACISSLLSAGQGLMEVTLLRAHDLVSKDMNGFSDPYCEVKVSDERKYKSSVKKKTLNPCWDESAIMGLPCNGGLLEVVLWDHDTFGTNDFLGSVSLSVEDIKRCSKLDLPQRWALQGVKTGVVEFRIKVIAEEPQAPSSSNNMAPYTPAVTIAEADMGTKKPAGRGTTVSHLSFVTKMTARPVPTLAPQTTQVDCVTESPLLCNKDDSPTLAPPDYPESPLLCNKDDSPTLAPPDYPRLIVLQSHLSFVTKMTARPVPTLAPQTTQVDCVTESPLLCNKDDSPTCSDTSSPRLPRLIVSPHTSSPDEPFNKSSEYSSFRLMKQKVKRGLKLRRFRSEVSVSEDKRMVNGKPSAVSSVTMEPSGGGESDATELLQLDLPHAVSQPNILEASPSLRPRRPHELKVVSPARPDRYLGVEGRVVQAQGLHVAHVAQLYCRVKLHLGLSTSDKMGRSLAKSRFLPAVPNPQFDLPFQVDAPQSVPRQAVLSFEVRSPGKEVLGSCRATLQELLAATSPDSNQVHTWLSLNNGASLEVMVAHGRELKKSGRKIFRSWSVHRIGKI
uniref:C2 domain-containing protein n=1 Tax=Timema monikensis TaxID=170555 RepID=A0A7R9EGE5_9NEOP|nr:unnamed protein product [Timema monikensis]